MSRVGRVLYRVASAFAESLGLVVLLGIISLRVGGAEPEATESSPVKLSVTDKQIAEWIEQLDDDRFSIREHAERHLLKAGETAIALLKKAVIGGSSREVRIRAERILLHLANERTASRMPVLNEHGMGTDTADLLKFLRTRIPSEERQRLIRHLIEQLGHDHLIAREDASRQLGDLGAAAREEILEAVQSGDAEVSWRARSLLRRIDSQANRLKEETLAALSTLKLQPSPNAVQTLLDFMNSISDQQLEEAASKALWASVTREHVGELRAAMRHEKEAVRRAGIVGLEAALGKDAVEELMPMLSRGRPAERLAAARALVDHRPAAAVEALVQLLDEEDRNLREQARWLLIAATGRKETTHVEAKAIEQWKEWLASNQDISRSLSVPIGAARWELLRESSGFREDFVRPEESVSTMYGRLSFESTLPGVEAHVADGIFVMGGQHEESDQRLVLTATELNDDDELPDRFEFRSQIGGEADGSAGYHVGMTVGNVKMLFHPAYSGGAFRIEQSDDHNYLTQNEDMGFTPVGGKTYDMTVDVQRDTENVQYDIAVINVDDPTQRFRKRVVYSVKKVGRWDRVALERSGRRGGAALFESLEVIVKR